MHISSLNKFVLATLLFAGFVSHGIAQNAPYSRDAQMSSTDISSTSPSSNERNVDLDTSIEVTFSKDMDENSINETTFVLREHAANENSMSGMQRNEAQRDDAESDDDARNQDARNQTEDDNSVNSRMSTSDTVSGTVSYSDRVAVFEPESDLKPNTTYSVSITTGVRDSESTALQGGHNWTFTTRQQ